MDLETLKRMGMSLPDGYSTCFAALKANPSTFVDVVGIVGDFLQPGPTKGTDFQCSFTLFDDPSMYNGFKVRIFSPTLEELPQIKNMGDVVVLENIKTYLHRGHNMITGISHYSTRGFVLPWDTIPDAKSRQRYVDDSKAITYHPIKADEDDFKPTTAHLQWAITLKELFMPKFSTGLLSKYAEPPVVSRAQHITPITPSSSMSTHSIGENRNVAASSRKISRGKFSMIENVKENMFCDLVGEIVKSFVNQFGDYLELYLTDYTSNKDLMEIEAQAQEQKGSSVPAGKMTIHIEVHQPHFASVLEQGIDVGDIVRLTNVRIKRSNSNYLEANMWRDLRFPEKACVFKVYAADAQVIALKERREAYRSQNFLKAGRQEPKASRQNKRKKAQALQQNEQSKSRKLGAEDGDKTTKEVRPKSNVNNLYSHARPSTFADLLNNGNRHVKTSTGIEHTLPFINAIHRVRLRVIDYFPHNVRDFAAPTNESKTAWTWDFWLVVCAGDRTEGEQRAIHLEVSGRQGELLLSRQATNLRSDPDDLVKLKETLFLLWGPLAEAKDKFLAAHPRITPDESFSAVNYNITAENRPFDACVAEYGVPVLPEENGEDGDVVMGEAGAEIEREWMRCYKLVGTQIFGY